MVTGIIVGSQRLPLVTLSPKVAVDEIVACDAIVITFE
jgi:hypothetical protein